MQKPLDFNDVVSKNMSVFDMIRHFKPDWSNIKCVNFSTIHSLHSIKVQKELVEFLNKLFLTIK